MNDNPRADREIIRQAAAAVRSTTIADQYRRGQHTAVALSMALLLDELALHVSGLSDDLRAAVTGHCRAILDHRGAE